MHRIGLNRASRAIAVFLMIAAGTVRTEEARTSPPPITESYTMLYYRELGPAKTFYGDVLALTPVMVDEGFALYRIAGGSAVGLIREGPGAYHRVQTTNAVMLSIVTTDVDAWYARVHAQRDTRILKQMYERKDAGIRGFLMEDPGGYTVELFEWLK